MTTYTKYRSSVPWGIERQEWVDRRHSTFSTAAARRNICHTRRNENLPRRRTLRHMGMLGRTVGMARMFWEISSERQELSWPVYSRGAACKFLISRRGYRQTEAE
jgi:hypothetical protein